MADNKKIAQDVLEAVGGASNVINVVHCMTRLRFSLKDKTVPNDDEVKKINGVIGVQEVSGQYQIIIGQNVGKVYDEVCAIGNFAKASAIEENLDEPAEKQKISPKTIGKAILDYLSGSMVPLIPVFLSGGLSRSVASVIGPTLLNLVGTDSSIYILFNDLIYNAAFAFIPIYLGYTAAKKLGATPALGMFMGGILMSPTLVNLVTSGGSLDILGIQVPMINYTQSVLPIVLCMPVLYWVEKGIRKIMPDVLTTIFTPFCTMIIMMPIGLLVFGPLGTELGQLVSTGIFALGEGGGILRVIGTTIVGGIWQILVVTGMHVALIQLAKIPLLEVGYDPFVFVSSNAALFAVFGMCFGAFLRIRKKEEKSQALGFFISGLIGGVTEPALFGLAMRYKRPMIGMIAGGAAGGFLAGLLNVVFYNAGGGSNFLCLLAYLPGGTTNMIMTLISYGVGFVVAAVVTYLFGFEKKDLAELTAKN